jgi:pimeloyl-ACP methyl ester carboxylesterase
MIDDLRWSSLTFASTDGLNLHARDYGPRHGDALPVLCLPGLARTAADFHELASALASDGERPRRVLAVDYRGRGLSDRDPNPANYDVRVENGDIQALLTVADIGRAAFVGTSRGGIHIMALAALRPAAIAAAVLNDIGPVIEMGGLLRIKAYVGRLGTPSSIEDAAAAMRAIAPGFTRFSEADWLQVARRTYRDEGGRLVADYDPALTASLDNLSNDAPVPVLWHLFDGLAEIPLMAIRGENSDILSASTFESMAERHKGLELLTIPGQAHAPPLWEPEVISRIAGFIRRSEP